MTRAFHAAGLLPACAILLFLLSGCASAPPKPPQRTQDTIVLLPDASGKTGAIVVSSGGKEVRLSESRQAVVVQEGSPPGKPFIMSGGEVDSVAAAALKALPPPPKQYILYFEHNTAVLTAKSRELLKKVIRDIKEHPPVDISVVGHTDTVGNRTYNYQLSYKRARAVADQIVSQGIDRSILEITSHGKENPLIPTGDQVHEPRNRRVEVTVR
jgi:outer membrane protein OmpA-like peptidoglycan-associated protein